MLGPVEVRGAAGPFRRRAATELVVYLALHRRGAPNEVWGAALWPDRTVASSTLYSTASLARRALGASADGGNHLTRSGGRLCLGPRVGTDVDRFVRLIAADGLRGAIAALSLVRGRLLEGLRASDWAVFDGTQAELESMVVTAALSGAAEALARGKGDQAEWLIRKGLLVNPFDERLYRGLLRATEAQGNQLGLRGAMAELLSLASDAGGPTIDPQTVALYRKLQRRGVPAARGDLLRL